VRTEQVVARTLIWRSAQKKCRFWCDGRMLGEVIRVLVVAEEQGWDYYPTTLFAQSEAESGSCTARSTIYTASIAAGMMVHGCAGCRWIVILCSISWLGNCASADRFLPACFDHPNQQHQRLRYLSP